MEINGNDFGKQIAEFEAQIKRKQKNGNVSPRPLAEWTKELDGHSTEEIANSFKELHDFLCLSQQYDARIENAVIGLLKLVDKSVTSREELVAIFKDLLPKN